MLFADIKGKKGCFSFFIETAHTTKIKHVKQLHQKELFQFCNGKDLNIVIVFFRGKDWCWLSDLSLWPPFTEGQDRWPPARANKSLIPSAGKARRPLSNPILSRLVV